MVRWRDIEDDARLASAHPLLKAAVEHVAHYQIRNRGTVGGSIAHADPAAEMPGIAVTCDAEIAVTGSKGARTIRADDFFVGALTTALEPDEIITEIRLPTWPAKRRWGFREFSRRRGDFAMAAAALFYDQDASRQGGQRPCRRHRPGRSSAPSARGRGGLNGRVVDEALMERAAEVTSATVEAQEDIHASADYRRVARRHHGRARAAKRRRTIIRVRRSCPPTSRSTASRSASTSRRARRWPIACATICGSPAPMSAASTASAAPAP